jgi:hypothetical protein
VATIEIDFEVFKALTLRRQTEADTYNDVIRSLLGMPPDTDAPNLLREAWMCKGVRFPVGTEFRARYKGKTYTATVSKNGLLVEGSLASSPSDAARRITGNNVNGWDFWECRFPGEPHWTGLGTLRHVTHG